MSRKDEFYVGYLPLPWGHSRFLRVAIPATLWLLLVIEAVVLWTMRDPGEAVWATAEAQVVRGVLREQPFAMLELEDGGRTYEVMLVETGKMGSSSRIVGKDGMQAEVTGFLLERDGRRMIEVLPGEEGLRVLDGAIQAAEAMEDLGSVTLRGEILDAKCYLGAMKPGDGRGHKACATLCVRGGIPPLLVTRDAAGVASYFHLASAGPISPGEIVLDLLGEPVEVRGRLRRRGDLYIVELDEESPVSRLRDGGQSPERW